jgi:CDP-diacylglycerol--serine O-phosphatidyltransferase
MLAAIVHFCGGYPIQHWWPWGVLWLSLIGLLAALMVSAWRYASFKDLGFRVPGLLLVVVLAAMIFLIWNFSQPVLLAMATGFVLSGILTRIGGALRRTKRTAAEPATQESPANGN